uniref:TBC1 domain family member 23 n=1 Tax=Albugo laibachii Nc14 TaxID=890382 RepID=F0W5J2_9STRA|nr:conserved hypothetical protein [Albugo laibachii Nc14]|eukprot:CCA16383.1 conserved hypothetical protein [Albugo laibachii Nc14]
MTQCQVEHETCKIASHSLETESDSHSTFQTNDLSIFASVAELSLENGNTPDSFVEQIQKELSKRRPDPFVLSVLCRSLLLTEEERTDRTYCDTFIPDTLRPQLWAALLGVRFKERMHLDQSIAQVEEDLDNQKVILGDATRTRAQDARFRDPGCSDSLTRILTYYCKAKGIRYKQGMNEVLAPFLMLQQQLSQAHVNGQRKESETLDSEMIYSEGVLYQCFYAMIERFLPHTFQDEEFHSLQCSLQLYRLLLLYHDPELCQFLDQHDMSPEIYLTPWFMTLFARNLERCMIFTLWDFFLIQSDPALLQFIAVLLVCDAREELIQTDLASLPQALSSIKFRSIQHVKSICLRARVCMDERTPVSFKTELKKACFSQSQSQPSLGSYFCATCLHISSEELISNWSRRTSDRKKELGRGISGSLPTKINYVVFDCRISEDYEKCHLSSSQHIDPKIVSEPERLSALLKGFDAMKGCHFCFVGPAKSNALNANSESASFLLRSTAMSISSRVTSSIARLRPRRSSQAEVVESYSELEDFSMTVDEQGRKQSSLPSNDCDAVELSKTDSHSIHESIDTAYSEHIVVIRIALMFLQKGFKHVSILEGGFDALQAQILSMDESLIDRLLVHSRHRNLSETLNLSHLPPNRASMFENKGRSQSEEYLDRPQTTSPMKQRAGRGFQKLTQGRRHVSHALTQGFQQFTAAAKDAVGGNPNVKARRHSSWMLSTDTTTAGSHESALRSFRIEEVVFHSGPLGILFQASPDSYRYQAMVDSLVPESQAYVSQQIQCGDILVAVNGKDLSGLTFFQNVERLKEATRPMVLRFQRPIDSDSESLPTLSETSIPSMLAPILVRASMHSLSIIWPKVSLPGIRYQLQYAFFVEGKAIPWDFVKVRESGAAYLEETTTNFLSEARHQGLTDKSFGTIGGLRPGQRLIFRVRCGNSSWGSYSPPSNVMHTLLGSSEEGETDPMDINSGHEDMEAPNSIFIAGENPDLIESGVFYFRILQSIRARTAPSPTATKLELVLKEGTIIKCSERYVAPGTSQIFVKLWQEDRSSDEFSRYSDDDTGAWAFENAPDGTLVLERLAEEAALASVCELEFSATLSNGSSQAFQHQAKALVTSLLTASGLKSPARKHSTGSGSDCDECNDHSDSEKPGKLAPPRILQVFAVSSTSLIVTWEPISDVGITMYQIQYAKNRLTALWRTVRDIVPADTLKHQISNLQAGTQYTIRIRGGNRSEWGAYSDVFDGCRTMSLDEERELGCGGGKEL